jgi:hypothetical protein
VTLTRTETDITVQLRWFTNEVETSHLPLPSRQNRPTPASVVERIRQLSEHYPDGETADILNGEGMKTAHGNAFTAKRVEMIRRSHTISKRPAQP